MEDVKALAVKILDECRERIQANMAKRYRTSKGERWVNASGSSSEAFKVTTEAGGTSVRLVYRGDDVAPLDSIQYGSDEVPTIEQAAQWREEKMRSGAKDLPSAKAIVSGIEKRGGTERFHEPQEWIIGPEVKAAVDALNDQIPREAMRAVRDMLFSR
jgi:hypothetical protein